MVQLFDEFFPFGTLLFLLAAPLNALFIFGTIVESMSSDTILDIMPMEFFILNFAISLCGVIIAYRRGEWYD